MTSNNLAKKLEIATKVYDHLAKQGREGKIPLSIGRELGVSVSEVKEIVQRLKGTFVKVGDTQRYTINRFKSANKNTLQREFKEAYQERDSGSMDSLVNIVKVTTGLLS